MQLLRIFVLIFIVQICQFLTPDEYLNLEVDNIKHVNNTDKLTEEQLKIIEMIKNQDDSLMYEHIENNAKGNDAFYEGEEGLLVNDELQLIIICTIIIQIYQKKIQCINKKLIQRIQQIKSKLRQ